MARKRGGNFALGTLMAVGIGYVAGILTAPKSGRDTRKQLSQAAASRIAESEKTLKKLYADLSKTVDRAQEQAAKTGAKAKREANEAIRRAKKTMKTAGELLSAVREGEADNADLQTAISEAKDAYKHLKRFVRNDPKKTTGKT